MRDVTARRRARTALLHHQSSSAYAAVVEESFLVGACVKRELYEGHFFIATRRRDCYPTLDLIRCSRLRSKMGHPESCANPETPHTIPYALLRRIDVAS